MHLDVLSTVFRAALLLLVPVIQAVLTDLEIRPYMPGKEGSILDCMRACFGFAPEPGKWKHLYLDNPVGKPLIVLAQLGQIVVSHTAMLPRWIRAFGREGVAGHSIDAMTLPCWQRNGLNGSLAVEARRLAGERGFLVTYGVSNEQSTPGILKYQKRSAVRPFPVMLHVLKPVGAAAVLARRELLRVLGLRRPGERVSDAPPDCAVAGPWFVDLRFTPAGFGLPPGWSTPAFDERHTRLFLAAEAIPPIALIRNSAHLTWRYPPSQKSPYFQLDVSTGETLSATVIVRVAELFGLRLVYVMEWLWTPTTRPDGVSLMREVLQFARAAGAHGVLALAMPGTLQRGLLRHLGFIGVPERFFPKTVVLSARPEKDGEETTRWFEASNWYLTWGDGFIL